MTEKFLTNRQPFDDVSAQELIEKLKLAGYATLISALENDSVWINGGKRINVVRVARIIGCERRTAKRMIEAARDTLAGLMA